MVQTIAEEIWEEGWRKGFAEGELIGAREVLQTFLTSQFGPLPEELVQRIESCTDRDRLMASLDQLPSLVSLGDFQL